MKIGERRVVAGRNLPRLYPGEIARATRIERGDRPNTYVAVDWLVEPMPGLHGWWLRMRYRLFWWVPGVAPPEISVDVQLVHDESRKE